MDSIAISDLHHEAMMARGSDQLRRSIAYARNNVAFHIPRKSVGGGELIWGGLAHEKGTWRPSPEMTPSRARSDREYQLQMERREFVETLRTFRDPCPRCGVRADIGCKHQRTNA